MTERERLVRKSALLTRRHSQMAAIDAPAIDRLGWMKMYRDACEVVFRRLREIETVR